MTLDDVARAAHVSTSTASRALRGDPRISATTTARVREAAGSLGYHGPHPVARALRTATTSLIGVMCAPDHWRTMDDPVVNDTFVGLVEVLTDAGYGAVMLPYAVGAGEASIQSQLLDAVVVAATHGERTAHVELMLARGTTLVLLEAEERFDAPGVVLDDRAAMRTLAHRAKELGHRRADVVMLPTAEEVSGAELLARPERIDTRPARDRLLGVLDAGLRVERVWRASAVTEEEGARLGAALLASGEVPSLVVCQSDRLASGVTTTLSEAGLRVPEDVSVTGFDGLDPATTGGVELTTIVQDARRKGALAAAGAVALAQGLAWTSVSLELPQRLGRTLAAARA